MPTSCLLYSMSRCFALVCRAFGCAERLVVRCPVKELQASVMQKKNICIISIVLLHVGVCWSRLLDPDGVTHSGVSISPTTFVFHSLFVRSPETLCPEHGSQKRPFPSYVVSCVGHSHECCKRSFPPPKKHLTLNTW